MLRTACNLVPVLLVIPARNPRDTPRDLACSILVLAAPLRHSLQMSELISNEVSTQPIVFVAKVICSLLVRSGDRNIKCLLILRGNHPVFRTCNLHNRSKNDSTEMENVSASLWES